MAHFDFIGTGSLRWNITVCTGANSGEPPQGLKLDLLAASTHRVHDPYYEDQTFGFMSSSLRLLNYAQFQAKFNIKRPRPLIITPAKHRTVLGGDELTK